MELELDFLKEPANLGWYKMGFSPPPAITDHTLLVELYIGGGVNVSN